MNRNDISIRKGRCKQKDNVRFDDVLHRNDHWKKCDSQPSSYDHVVYLEYYEGYYLYYAWNDDHDFGNIYRQRDTDE